MNKHIGACILTCVFLRIVYVYELVQSTGIAPKNRRIPFRLPLENRMNLFNPLFYPGLSPAQEKEQECVLRTVHAFFSKHSIEYRAHGGLVLGALRHHGFVPWDSDVDLKVRDQSLLKDALSKDSVFLTARKVAYVQRGHYIFTSSGSLDPETWVHGNPVPQIEVGFNWKQWCQGDAKRLLFSQNDLVFWTCPEEVDKWKRTALVDDCNAAWNHPSVNSILDGRHLGYRGNVSIPMPIRWKQLLEKTTENPNGMWESCQSLRPFYNFAEPSNETGNAAASSPRTCHVSDERSPFGNTLGCSTLFRGSDLIQKRCLKTQGSSGAFVMSEKQSGAQWSTLGVDYRNGTYCII